MTDPHPAVERAVAALRDRYRAHPDFSFTQDWLDGMIWGETYGEPTAPDGEGFRTVGETRDFPGDRTGYVLLNASTGEERVAWAGGCGSRRKGRAG